jgi:hypothetical protein
VAEKLDWKGLKLLLWHKIIDRYRDKLWYVPRYPLWYVLRYPLCHYGYNYGAGVLDGRELC